MSTYVALFHLQVAHAGRDDPLYTDNGNGSSLLKRQGNKIFWNGQDAGRLVGVNYGVYTGSGGRSLEQQKKDLENIRALGANYVRLGIHPGEWRHHGTKGLDRVEELARHALSIGMFVSIDYHGIGFPGRHHKNAPWNAGSPTEPLYDSDLELMRSFWREAARRFKGNGAVFFDLWDEPVDRERGNGPWEAQWVKFAPVWQELIDLIRAEGANNLITIGGDHWARNLTNYDSRPLVDAEDNFTFRFHEFAGDGARNAEMFLGDLWRRFPIIGGGWGIDSKRAEPTGGYVDFVRIWLDERFAGWAAWIWSTGAQPHQMLREWDPPRLTNYGSYVRDKIRGEDITTRP